MLENLESLKDIVALEKTPFAEQNIADTTYEVFANSARLYGNNTAIEFFLSADEHTRSTQISHKQLFQNINRTANMFRAHGIERGDVVAFVLPNLPETHYAIWGGETAGIAMSLNPLLEPEQLASLLSTAKAKYLVCLAPTPGTDIWQKCVEASKQVNSLRSIFAVEITSYSSGLKKFALPLVMKMEEIRSNLDHLPVFNFSSELNKYSPEKLEFSPPQKNDIASYFCTGGTTGLPKIARRTQFSETYNAWTMTQVFRKEFDESLTIFCGLPLFHVNGQIVTGLAPWSVGGKVILGTPQGYRAPNLLTNFWRIIEHYKVNLFSGVPTLYAGLLTQPIGNANISSLSRAICGAAPLPKELYRQFTKTTGIHLIEGYGLTEGACVSSLNPGKSEDTVGSIGFRIPYQNMLAVILDEDGNYLRDARFDEVGCIAIYGPNLFAGYVEERHNEGIWIDRHGETWLNTGDLGRQDTDGMFWLTGRKKELIIRGGHNIDPGIIEEALHSHPDVKLAAAVPRPDAYAGELPVVYVELRDNSGTTSEELMDFAQSRIPEKAAWPKKISVVDKLPVTPVGKLHKPSLCYLEIESVIRQVCLSLPLNPGNVNVYQDPKLGVVSEVTMDASSELQRRFLDEIEKYSIKVSINATT